MAKGYYIRPTFIVDMSSALWLRKALVALLGHG